MTLLAFQLTLQFSFLRRKSTKQRLVTTCKGNYCVIRSGKIGTYDMYCRHFLRKIGDVLLATQYGDQGIISLSGFLSNTMSSVL